MISLSPGAGRDFGFTKKELRRIRSLNDPWDVQKFLDALPYHFASTAWSPKRVLRENTAHCFEGAIFAAAALRVNGYEPLLVDFEAVRDTDHVLAVYKKNSRWGAVAKSNFSGLRYREPVYRTIRELALSYFDDYFNLKGERTLRRFSAPVNLGRFDSKNWMTTEKQIWFIADYLTEIPHNSILKKGQAQRLHPVGKRSLEAGLIGYQEKMG
jgi:hypothetical protein